MSVHKCLRTTVHTLKIPKSTVRFQFVLPHHTHLYHNKQQYIRYSTNVSTQPTKHTTYNTTTTPTKTSNNVTVEQSNTDISIEQLTQALLNTLPQHSILWCCAYGSRIFAQSTIKNTNSLIDIIIVVSNIHTFHSHNIKQNKRHYSLLMRVLGINTICHINKHTAANIYYNTDVTLNNTNIRCKYGIVELNDIITDCTKYSRLYVAGRLHKPVKILLNKTQRLDKPLQQNLSHAVNVALLLLATQPQHNTKQIVDNVQTVNNSTTTTDRTSRDGHITFTATELYHIITSISYTGDIRMLFRAEQPHKISNIVTHNIQHFNKLYEPILKQYIDRKVIRVHNNNSTTDTVYTLYHTQQWRYNRLTALPSNIKQILCERDREERSGNLTNDEVIHELSYMVAPEHTYTALQYALKKVNRYSSTTQMLNGLLTAGIGKSIRYAFAKIRKAITN